MFMWCDSVDHYDFTHILQKWTLQSFCSIVNGRNGKGISMSGGGGISKTLPPKNVIVVGWACQIDPAGSQVPSGSIYNFACVNTNRLNSILFSVYVLSDSTIAIFAGNAHVLIANPKTFTVSPGVWNYYEVKVTTISTPTNILINAELRINGQALGGANNADSGVSIATLLDPSGAGDVHFFGPGHGVLGATVIDDIYICDQAGGINDDYLGDVRIGCIYPRSDVQNSWTPLTGSTRFSLINEHNPDDDLKYIFDNTVGDVQTCMFDTVQSLQGTIPALQFLQYARKDNEGSRGFKIAENGAPPIGSVDIYMADTYKYYNTPLDNAPNGNPWTPAIINATSFGIKTTV